MRVAAATVEAVVMAVMVGVVMAVVVLVVGPVPLHVAAVVCVGGVADSACVVRAGRWVQWQRLPCVNGEPLCLEGFHPCEFAALPGQGEPV